MRKHLKDIFVMHWQVKLLALTIAFAIWFYAHSRLKEEVVLREVPVNIEVPEGYRLLYQSASSVRLHLSGPQHLMQKRQEEARENYLRFTVRLSSEDIPDGLVKRDVAPEWLNVPKPELLMMNVAAMHPDRIELFASPIVRRTLPVEATFSGRPPEGYEIVGHNVTPSAVTVEGPSAVLERMESIKTLPIPVWDARESFGEYQPLQNEHEFDLNDNIIVVSYEVSEPQVTVNVSINVGYTQVELEDIPLKLLLPKGFPYHAEIEDPRITVLLSGLPAEVDNVTSADVTAYVDLSDLEDEDIASGTTAPYKQRVHIILGIDAEVVEIKPDEEVTVRLTNQ